MPADNKGLASGGLTFKREISCGLSLPAAKPHTVVNQFNQQYYGTINRFEDLEIWQLARKQNKDMAFNDAPRVL